MEMPTIFTFIDPGSLSSSGREGGDVSEIKSVPLHAVINSDRPTIVGLPPLSMYRHNLCQRSVRVQTERTKVGIQKAVE